ncbi:hypothetical protein D0861_04111 [Hortaea werneckii]|uniref:Anaphase-promoting complex subunit 11 RING-H2 finger domain-containing protein n=1 Tax=Hortaea werneckii TaxID=91943 RepID=A0A3M7FL78_HORWE|nr:hypothetical protein D0861_04111 [Hortaea werneckii]
MKVTFSAYQAVAEWKWDLPDDSDDTCGICRVEFEGTCSKCKYPGDDCPISDWLQSDSSQGKCPMCRQPFKEKTADVATPATGQRQAMASQTPASETPARTPVQTPVGR